MRYLLALLTLFLSSGFVLATPVKPDPKDLLKQTQPPAHHGPARAGWYGSEMPAQPPINPTLEPYSAGAATQALRGSLLAAATPDVRALGLVFLLILLLRNVRQREEQRGNAELVPVPVQYPDSGRDRRAA
jgi:hypothetical protein